MADLYNLDSYSATINFISGIFWIPYTLFLFYLFYEHHVREKFPQNLIILLLALGAVFRTVWFLGYRQFQSTLGFLIINRIAILLQFTALAVLILMWMRALKITQIAYSKQPSPLLLSSTSSASFNNHNQSSSRKELLPNSRSPSTNTITSHNTSNTNSTRITNQTSRQALMFKQVEAQFQQLVWYVSVVVFLVWCVILLSLIGDAEQKQQNSRHFFNANIIMISSLCLLEAIFTLVVGVRTALALQKELAPVFVSNNNNNNYKKGGTRLHPSRHTLKVSTSNNDLTTRDSAVNNTNVTTNANSNNNSNNNSYHDERLISSASDTAEVWHRVSRCCQWITCYDDCLGLRSLMNLYRLFFTKSQSALGLQLQRDVLRSLLTVSLIVFVFFFLRALGYLYRFIEAPVTPPNIHNAIGEIWYPLFFYQLPELIPNLAIAAGISPPNGVLKWSLFFLYNALCCVSQFTYNNNDSASHSVTTVSHTTARHTRSYKSNSRQQNMSVSSANTFLSSLTGGPTVSSLNSGVSATSVPQQQSQLLAPIEENDHHDNNHNIINNENSNYKNNTKLKNNSTNKGNIIMNNITNFNSHYNTSNPGSSVATSHTSDDHNLQQLQLPFHVQQQLHLAQQVYQSSPQFTESESAYMNQNVHNPTNHFPFFSDNLEENDNEVVRDSETSQLSTVVSRVSETSLSQQRKQQSKSSFSIASSPMNNNNNIANYFVNNHTNNDDVLVDDIVDNKENNVPSYAISISNRNGTTSNINIINNHTVSGSQNSVSAWSPLTGTSAARSYQQSYSQQSTYIRNNNSNNNINNSQSQQRSSFISMFFHRTSSNNNNTNNNTNMVCVSPAVSPLASGALTHRTDNINNNNHKTVVMRQESTDYEELLYRLNSYLPERLHSSDALYHGFDDSTEHSTPHHHYVHTTNSFIDNNYCDDNIDKNNHNDNNNNYNYNSNNKNNDDGYGNAIYSDSTEREHALAMYLAPKSRRTRSLPKENVSALNNDVQSTSSSKNWYLYDDNGNNSVQSCINNVPPAMDEEVGVCTGYVPPPYINKVEKSEIDDEGSESSSQRKSPHKQSARSKSWLDKVMR